mgnify:CR=1 FL=1
MVHLRRKRDLKKDDEIVSVDGVEATFRGSHKACCQNQRLRRALRLRLKSGVARIQTHFTVEVERKNVELPSVDQQAA